MLIVFFGGHANCSTIYLKSLTANNEEINSNMSGIEIKNDTFPKKKIYAQYGDIILDQVIDPGEYRYISEDESIQIDQPWDGVLIHQTLENGDEKIEFYDKNHNLLKTIDLDKLNPYTVDKYPLLSSTRGFSGGVESILKHVMDNPNPKQEVSEYRKDTEVFAQDNYFRNIKNTNKHLVVKFDLIKMYTDILVGWECTFVVLDSFGNETGRLENIKYDCAYPIVTKDGKYLGFTYGSTLDDHFHHLFKNEGVKIYDLTLKKIIYEEISDSRGGNPSFGLTQEDEMFRILKRCHDKSEFVRTYKFLDCTNRILLKKDFKQSDLIEFGKCKSDKQILETFNFEKKQF